MNAIQPARWWKQPVVWLLFVLLGAALAASAWTIVVASHNPDQPLAGTSTMPGLGVAQHAASASAPPSQPDTSRR